MYVKDIIRIVLFSLVVVTAFVFTSVQGARANQSSEVLGCFPEYFDMVTTLAHETYLYSTGDSDVFICDDIAAEAGMTGGLHVNRKHTVLVCFGRSLTVWIVNCNEA